ncbi:MAG: hypothetical protein MAG794_00181 [Gammaproteobacteria bacterium]|nr:hypothetical protein [Gammaproteobacteria bacterium]
MPELTFVLPHWMYWSGLVLFPLLAIWLVRREKPHEPRTRLPIAYFLWLTSGFVGLHRFYVRSYWGLIFIPLFLFVLYGNVQTRDAVNVASAARNEVVKAEFKLELAQEALEEGKSGADKKVLEARKALAAALEERDVTKQSIEEWNSTTGWTAALILLLLLIDATLLPRLVGAARQRDGLADPAPAAAPEHERQEAHKGPAATMHSRLTDAIDTVNGFVGEFVAYWAVIAVFVYYYEVIARYVFNSPTNWAHEGMFLMFGMQYLLSGGYALKVDAHVRVDVVYAFLPDRAKAITDIITSIFFFIFAVALVWTGWVFFSDSLAVWEVSFTEWQIQYWPVKFAIPLGAALLLMQGLSRLSKDILALSRFSGNGRRSGA